MINKITTALKVFQAGERVKDPAKWKSRAVRADLVAFLAAVIGALAAFGVVTIDMEQEQLEQIADSLIAIVPAAGLLFSTVMHLVTSSKIGVGKAGLQSKPDAEDS